MTISKKRSLVVMLIIAGMSVACAAQAEVLYYDNFDGDGASVLIGSTPDTTIGSNVWLGSTSTSAYNIYNDGSVGGTTSSSYKYTAWLPLDVEQNYIYTITVDLTTSYYSSTMGWLTAVLSDTAYTSAQPSDLTYTMAPYCASVRLQGNGGFSYYAEGDMVENNPPTTVVTSATGTFVLTLDTSGSAWKVSCSYNGTDMASYTFTSNPTDTSYIGIGRYKGVGTFNSLTVEATAVPEPSALALLGCGLIGLLAYAWRKRK